MTNKSKIIKLEKKKTKLKFWHNCGGWILCVNALIPTMLLMPCVMANIAPTLAIIESLYLGFSVLALFEHEIFGEKKIKQKIQNLDQEILNLVKTDKEEMNILIEHDKTQTLERELKHQKQLVKEMIKTKNQQAQSQKNYLKELTLKYKREAKSLAEKEIKEVLNIDESFNNVKLD